MQHLRCCDIDFQMHARRFRMEAGERALKVEFAIGDHRIDGAEAEIAGKLTLRLADAALEFLQRAEEFERRVIDEPPFLR